MLFVQEIDLWYRKDVRYPKYANIRNAMRFIQINTENINPDCDVFYQYSAFKQSSDGVKVWREYYKKFNEEIFTFGKRDRLYNLNNLIENIRILKNGENYKIMFCDDHFNTTKRRGHNEYFMDNNSPFSYTDVINETVFTLNPNQYGRVQYNDRCVMHYTEIWYYRMHTLNFINCGKDKFREKMFFRKVPDYEYRNMQYLRYC